MSHTVAYFARRFLSHCQSEKGLAKSSLRAYQSDLAHFCRFVGNDSRITKCSESKILEYCAMMQNVENRKATTIRRRIAVLKSFFRWLDRQEVLVENPFRKTDFDIRTPKKLPRNISAENMTRLLQSPLCQVAAVDGEGQVFNRDDLYRWTNRVAIELLFATGIRVGELESIELSDMRLADQAIRIRGKGARERTVFVVNDEILKLVKTYIQHRENFVQSTNRLLINSNGRFLSAQSIRARLREVAGAAGIKERLTPHMLRHTAATSLIEQSVDIRFVQRLLGHASISTTQIYTHVSDVALRDVLMRADPRSVLT